MSTSQTRAQATAQCSVCCDSTSSNNFYNFDNLMSKVNTISNIHLLGACKWRQK